MSNYNSLCKINILLTEDEPAFIDLVSELLLNDLLDLSK